MISVNEQKNVVFLGSPSSTPEKDFLRERGFIHITGIRVVHQGAIYHIGEKLLPSECGQWNINNSLTSITLPCGEVWLRSGAYELGPEEEYFLQLRGRRGFVPLANNEMTDHREILARIIDPYHGLSFQE